MSTIPAHIIQAIDDAYGDADTALSERVIALSHALEIENTTVKDVHAEWAALGLPNLVSTVTLGYAAAAVDILATAGFPTAAHKLHHGDVHAAMSAAAGKPVTRAAVDARIRADIVREAKRLGAPLAKRTARDAVRGLLDDVAPIERLSVIFGALSSTVPAAPKARGARNAGGTAPAFEPDLPEIVVPAEVADASAASEAARQSLAHALSLISGGATVTESIRDLLADLSALAMVELEPAELAAL